jgi:hypothetical protein
MRIYDGRTAAPNKFEAVLNSSHVTIVNKTVMSTTCEICYHYHAVSLTEITYVSEENAASIPTLSAATKSPKRQ